MIACVVYVCVYMCCVCVCDRVCYTCLCVCCVCLNVCCMSCPQEKQLQVLTARQKGLEGKLLMLQAEHLQGEMESGEWVHEWLCMQCILLQ